MSARFRPTAVPGIPASIREAAAAWRARRESETTAPDDAEFFAWLDADERNAMAYGDLEAAVGVLERLGSARPAGADADPDLLARSTRWRPGVIFGSLAACGLAAAVALIVIPAWRGAFTKPQAVAPASLNRTLDLADGSVVELKDGSRVEVAFTEVERRVHLVAGEAHFTVAKRSNSPFVVEANGVSVRAIGTAFNVRIDPANVEVLVTEGRVEVTPPAEAADEPRGGSDSLAPAAHAVLLGAGNRVNVPLASPGASPLAPLPVELVPQAKIDEILAWRDQPLVFEDATLADVVAAFNQHNVHKLEIADAALARQRFGGTFRPDAADAVVRLLEADFGVTAERLPDKTILRVQPRMETNGHE